MDLLWRCAERRAARSQQSGGKKESEKLWERDCGESREESNMHLQFFWRPPIRLDLQWGYRSDKLLLLQRSAYKKGCE